MSLKILFDARVLTHKHYTGIENYTKYILENMKEVVSVAKPKYTNKYLAHLWTHLILPFKKGDVLFCPANSAPIFIPKNKKLVLTIHDIAFLTYAKSFSRFFRLYYTFLIPFNIKRADQIITISEASKKEILRLFPNVEDKINIISQGIDSKYKIINEFKKKKQILYVGSINERKNIIGVIEAFEKLPKELDYDLIIVGNFFNLFSLSDKMKETIQRAKFNNKIIFKEGLNDKELIEEYNLSTVFIFPSFYEGFGFPPLEAMACGTPVITSNISSMPEVCGDAAMYVDPYDVDDISKKIEFLLANEEERERLIKKGLERVKHFTWEKSAKKHLDVIKGLVE